MKMHLRYLLLAMGAMAFGLCGSTSKAAFNFKVESISGPGFATYNSSSTSNLINLFGGAPFGNPGLTMNYSIQNFPSQGYFMLDSLAFVYLGNPAPLSLRVTITENAANFVGSGAPVRGFASFNASGNTTASFDMNTTFTPGVGPNSITFPLQNFPASTSPYDQSTFFTSGAATGQIESIFNINILSNSNISFSSGNTLGAIGVTDTLVPVPATAAVGLIALPVLALLRRRRRR